ncbi:MULTISPECIES: ddrA [Citrobacter freundii complex]|uniref:DdrA n=2 Tax=Citrobacter freundii complex TaxID=1344959 RepID=A0A9N8GVE3_9ENTR|nr:MULTISPECIES: ddrA [Citrobacter]EEE6681707.1 ddrA [Salmonella enterica subsp. diarizonae]MBC2622695.1 ddrA [Citrobacter cronae]CAB5550282.1 Uncharacterised protein [Citrobacter werkmanii]CAB5578371.1 Uncharacterised protein [Citrobacter werkmanii]CAB5591269.1 Uncharacterised protein [Citrobacter werkmanii]
MKLSAIERLDLSDKLDELLGQAKSATGIALLDLNDQIDEVLVKLGYGPTGEPDAPAGPPKIVTDFLAGEFNKQSATDFVATLRALEPFQSVFLTFDDIKAGALTWINENALQAA